MTKKEITSFPELAFYFLKKYNNEPLSANQLVEFARQAETNEEIKIKIESGYDKFTEEWIYVLVGGLRRDTSEGAAIHEGKERVFMPRSGSSSVGPWSLSEIPLPNEDYDDFKRRIRGSDTKKTSSGPKRRNYSKKSKNISTSIKDKEFPWYGEFLTKITSEDQYGDPNYTICIYEYGVEFRDKEKETRVRSRDPSEGPAIFDWTGNSGSDRVVFMVNDTYKNFKGPAVRYKGLDNSKDIYYFKNGNEAANGDDILKLHELKDALNFDNETLESLIKGRYDKDDCFEQLEKWKKVSADLKHLKMND